MSMGFCFYNNAGIAARAAQAAGARRVLILDWDVHHGNGAPASAVSLPPQQHPGWNDRRDSMLTLSEHSCYCVAADGAVVTTAGTQHIFEEDDTVLYMSLHRYDECAPCPLLPVPLSVTRYATVFPSRYFGFIVIALTLWRLIAGCACSGVFYPGTGGADEVGYLQGQGYSVNVPWPHGGMGNGACSRCCSCCWSTENQSRAEKPDCHCSLRSGVLV